MMTAPHGTILGGLVVTPDLTLALQDYRDRLGLKLIVHGVLPDTLAHAWDAPQSAGAPFAVLQPASGAPCHIRLLEQPDHPDFRPTRSFGWAAYELSIQRVFDRPAELAGSGFTVVGPPKQIPGMDSFVPMQVLGRGREMLYLNEVFGDMPNTDLPRAAAPTDRIFITILATPDRAASVAWYRDAIGLDESDSFTIPYTMINGAFGLPSDHMTTLTMMQKERMPIVEIDDYPPEAGPRPAHPGMMPPGNALVTLAVPSLDAVGAPFAGEVYAPDEAPYFGRRAAMLVGPAGERLELIETGGS